MEASSSSSSALIAIPKAFVQLASYFFLAQLYYRGGVKEGSWLEGWL